MSAAALKTVARLLPPFLIAEGHIRIDVIEGILVSLPGRYIFQVQ